LKNTPLSIFKENCYLKTVKPLDKFVTPLLSKRFFSKTADVWGIALEIVPLRRFLEKISSIIKNNSFYND